MGRFLVSFSALLAISVAVMLISWVLFVIFGQVTVRKLRKNPETRQALGLEFASGWDILNVAQALSIPKTIAQKLRHKSEAMGLGLEADPDLLYQYTTVFDRVLARLFYIPFFLSGTGVIILTLAYFLLDLG